MNVPFAHAGHWLASLAYAAPVIALVGWLGVVKAREGLARRRGHEPSTDNVGGTTPD